MAQTHKERARFVGWLAILPAFSDMLKVAKIISGEAKSASGRAEIRLYLLWLRDFCAHRQCDFSIFLV